MKTRKVLLAIVCFLLTLSIGLISNAETVMRDVDVEVNYDAQTKPNEIEFIITLKNGAVLLGDIDGDGYVNYNDYTVLKNIIENSSLTFEELFEEDATRAEQAADIWNRGAFSENGTIVINVSDLDELDEYLNTTDDDFDVFGIETIGTLKTNNIQYTRVLESGSTGTTIYKIVAECDSLPQMRQTIGFNIEPRAIGYVGKEPYKNDTALEYVYTIGQDQKDSAITLSDGVKSGNKVVFDINAPEGTQLVESEDDFEAVKLNGTLAEKASYEIVKDENGKLKIEVTLSEESEGTIGVTLKEMTLVTKENKTNNELSKMFTVENQSAQDDEDDEDNKEVTKLKILDKAEEKQNDGKIKVTITVNKELDSDKVPSGWGLSKDKKSISKAMKAGATEQITLTAKDGTVLKYSVTTEKEETLKKVKFNNHEYYIFEKNMTWKEAKEFCEKQGGYLVTITSKEEQQFIENMIKDNNGNDKRFWIGATDSTNGKWSWVTGEKYSYTNWGQNQPDSKEQSYAAIHGYQVTYLTGNVKSLIKSGEWDNLKNDGDSDRNNIYFICEWGDVAEDKGNEKLPSVIPQAGLGTTLTFAVVVVAGIALISLKKYREYKDIK